MTSKTTRFTTTLDWEVFNFLKAESAQQKTSQRSIVEAALKLYRAQKKKQVLLEGYQQMAADEEMSDWLAIANDPANA